MVYAANLFSVQAFFGLQLAVTVPRTCKCKFGEFGEEALACPRSSAPEIGRF